jgi:hypothetical protein
MSIPRMCRKAKVVDENKAAGTDKKRKFGGNQNTVLYSDAGRQRRAGEAETRSSAQVGTKSARGGSHDPKAYAVSCMRAGLATEAANC